MPPRLALDAVAGVKARVALITGLRDPESRQLSEINWFSRVSCCDDTRRENKDLFKTGCRRPAPAGAWRHMQCGCMAEAPCNATRAELLHRICDNYMPVGDFAQHFSAILKGAVSAQRFRQIGSALRSCAAWRLRRTTWAPGNCTLFHSWPWKGFGLRVHIPRGGLDAHCHMHCSANP